MRAAMLAERIKAARRHDLLLAALTGLLTALCAPAGWMLTGYIRRKAGK